MKQNIVIALLQYGENFAVLKRSEGKYTFPGGKVDPEETPQQAVLRETFEETGLKSVINRELAIDTTSNPDQVRYYYLCTTSDRDIILAEPDKFIEAKWMAAREVLDIFGDRLYPAIRDLMEQENRCSYKDCESAPVTPDTILSCLDFAKYADRRIPAVVQSSSTKDILRLDWLDQAALQERLQSETLSSLASDCDLDTLVLTDMRDRESDFSVPDLEALVYEKYSDGLVPAIVQDAISKDVLMVAFMNAAALEKTQATDMATFYTRSRQRLWTKGEESGNFMKVTGLTTNKNRDAVLMQVEPQENGVACHTGQTSCFYRRFDV